MRQAFSHRLSGMIIIDRIIKPCSRIYFLFDGAKLYRLCKLTKQKDVFLYRPQNLGYILSETTHLTALSLPRPTGAGPSRSQAHGRPWFLRVYTLSFARAPGRISKNRQLKNKQQVRNILHFMKNIEFIYYICAINDTYEKHSFDK